MESIVTITFGSHLYGTSTPSSDEDFKGVHVPTRKDILLQKVKQSDSAGSDYISNDSKNVPGQKDCESYSIQRFLGLVAKGETIALDMLFAPADKLTNPTPLWNRIVENRHRLLSKKLTGWVQYCLGQANKYGIKGERVAAVRAVVNMLENKQQELGLTVHIYEIEQDIKELLGPHISIVQQVVNSRGDIGFFLCCCDRKVGFDNTIKQALEMYTNILAKYGARAKAAEENSGVDWKALSHAVRVANEAIELFTTGTITFPRPEAKLLTDIKLGRVDYKQVSTMIDDLLVQVYSARDNCSLPDEPDYTWMDDFVLDVHHNIVNGVSYNEKVHNQ